MMHKLTNQKSILSHFTLLVSSKTLEPLIMQLCGDLGGLGS